MNNAQRPVQDFFPKVDDNAQSVKIFDANERVTPRSYAREAESPVTTPAKLAAAYEAFAPGDVSEQEIIRNVPNEGWKFKMLGTAAIGGLVALALLAGGGEKEPEIRQLTPAEKQAVMDRPAEQQFLQDAQNQ